MSVLCVIPARGGSRNTPLQHFRLLAGKPLLTYTAEAALAAHVSRTVLVTDDRDVAEGGRRSGLEVLMETAAGSGMQALVQGAVRQVEAAGEKYDAVCILDPGAPFRRPEDIEQCVALLERSGADSVVTVVPVPQEYHPQRVYLQSADGSLAPAGGSAGMPPAFHADGSVCLIRRDALMNGNALSGGRTLGYAVDPVRLVNLDRPEEWGRAERIARLGSHRATPGRLAALAGPRRNLPMDWILAPIADPLVGAGVGPLREGELGSSPVARGKYLDPVWKPANPRWREAETSFAIRDSLLPPEREVVAHEILDPVSPALLMPHSRPGNTPAVCRIEDPFQPHAELPPDIRTAEAPLVAALAARHLEGTGLERAQEPARREVAGGSRTVPVAVEIELSGLLAKAAGRVKPVQPFHLDGAELEPPRKAKPQARPWPSALAASAFFPDPLPIEPASRDLLAHEELIYAPAAKRDGRLLPRTSKPQEVRVEVIGTHPAELADGRPLAFEHPLAGAPPAALKGRSRLVASTWRGEGWEQFGQETAPIVFASANSRAHGVAWPTTRAFLFSHVPERPARAGVRDKAASFGLYVFPVPAAGMPVSAALKTRLRGANTKKLAAPAVRADGKTILFVPPLSTEFVDSGAPRGTPIFRGALRVALMPGGVFHLLEIEDYEDYGTWKRAREYPSLLMIPESGCGIPEPAWIAGVGYHPMFAGPYAGTGAHYRVYGEFPPAQQLALAENQVDLMGMDFGAIADASSSRWRLPFKKAALFT